MVASEFKQAKQCKEVVKSEAKAAKNQIFGAAGASLLSAPLSHTTLRQIIIQTAQRTALSLL